LVKTKLDSLSDQLATQLSTVAKAAEKIDSVAASGVAGQHLGTWADTVNKQPSSSPAAAATDGTTAIAAVSDPGDDDGPPFQTVVRRKSPQRRRQQQQSSSGTSTQVRLRGTKAATDKVRAVPRTGVLAAFVGRLHKDTTAENLTTYLTAEGMRGIVCRKLTCKNGRVFDTAAFYVACCRDSADLFYDEQRWPEGVELRDWVYK